jgi:tetratricopeptide (TPR) repeat protein
MKKLLRNTVYMTSIGLLMGQSCAEADDRFILQPKIQAPVQNTEPVKIETPSETSAELGLVLQPPKADATTNQNVPKQVDPFQLPSLGATQLSNDSKSLVPPVQEAQREADGLVWKKRGAQESVPAPTTKIELTQTKREATQTKFEANSIQPLKVIEVKGPVTAKAAPPANATLPNVEVASEHSVTSRKPVTTVSTPATSVRAQLASKVSKKIIGDKVPQKQLSQSGASLMGPAAVERELTSALIRSEQLAKRGVFLSAREEARKAELQLARFLDSNSSSYTSEPCLNAAQVALRESADFVQPNAAKILHELVNAHDTPALKNVNVSRVSPSTLKQSYYQYAEQQLLAGAQQHIWFSDIFYTLGRTYQAEADGTSGEKGEHLRAQAVVYYRAATNLRPSNSLATNQLGYVLLQLDRPAEARDALIASVQSNLDKPALQNLVEACRRLGDSQNQSWALGQIAMLNHVSNVKQSNTEDVVLELDNSSFSATTPAVPYNVSKQPQTAGVPSGAMR